MTSPTMPATTASSPSESLDAANRNLCAHLQRLMPESITSSPLRPEDLGVLLTKLLRAADCFRKLPPEAAPNTQHNKAISEYRNMVEQLAQILPQVRGHLLAEKVRIENARAHLAATAAWAQASAKTL